MDCDLLITGGPDCDPASGKNGAFDLAVREGKIWRVEPDLSTLQSEIKLDARGLLVTPGLIDLHVHVYPRHTRLGLDPDPLAAAGGVTTMLDTGSAGSRNFAGFRKDVIDRAETRILALVNLSCIGLAADDLGELMDRRYADPQGVLRTLKQHPGVAVGVKIRAGKHIIGEGPAAWANFREAVEAARQSNTWLMVHIGESPMSVPEMLEHLAPGDCITHCFKGGSTRILDEQGQLFPEVQAAVQRGVTFDVGHGFGSFEWETATQALAQGFEPTTISTDLHTLNVHGPVYDLPTTLSKFLMLGLSLPRVIEMATLSPAKILGLSHLIGTLRPGSLADIALFEKRTGRFLFTDSYRQTRTGTELLTAAATIRGGQLLAPAGSLRSRHLAQ